MGNIKLEFFKYRCRSTFCHLANEDYRLSNFSNCIGSGLDTSIVFGDNGFSFIAKVTVSDILGNPRPNPVGSNPDIGAYENSRAFPLIPGCMDSLACNYNPLANISDSSCAVEDSIVLVEVACDSFNFNGLSYDSSGIYSFMYSNISGCDSSITLDLTINNSDTSYLNVTVCDSFIWQGATYTQSGTFF